MAMMPAISLWQPWASLWVADEPRLKWHETRHWPPPARYLGQRILVHAAKTREGIRDAQADPDLATICAARFGSDWAKTLPFGGFVGSVLLEAAKRIPGENTAFSTADFVCGNWAPGRFAWLGVEPRSGPLIESRGQQGFWLADA